LAKVYCGVARDTLREHRVAEDLDLSVAFWLVAAQAGDLEAMSTVANYYEGTLTTPSIEPSYKSAVSWYQALVTEHEKLADDADLSEDDFELHRILAKMALLYEQGGKGLTRSAARAYELYNDAAAAAEEMMKSKLANKYYEKAAELEAEAENEAPPASPAVSAAESDAQWSVNKLVFHGPGDVLESLADTLLEGLDANAPTAVANFRNAYSMYKTAVQQEVEAEMGESAVKTWVCMCTLKIGKDGEVTRVLPERMRYLSDNGLHVRLAGALRNVSGHIEAMQYVLHMAHEDADVWVENEPLNKAGCYETCTLFEMQQHWSNLAA